MSYRYAALLRGINVGGHRVKMDRLRAIVGELGYSDVETLIASGNVLFSTETADTAALERQIEQHLEAELGYEVATFIRTADQLADVIACAEGRTATGADAGSWRRSAPDDGEGSCYVIFCQEPPDTEVVARFRDACSDTDDFQVEGREVYWRLPGKLSDSPLFGRESDRLMKGLRITMRNLNTVRRLAAKL